MTAEELAQMTRLRRPLEAEHWRGVLNVLATEARSRLPPRHAPRRAAHGHRCHRRSRQEGRPGSSSPGSTFCASAPSFMPRRGPRPGSWRLGAADDDGAAPHHLLCAARHPRRDRARHEPGRGGGAGAPARRHPRLDPARGRSRARARAPGGIPRRDEASLRSSAARGRRFPRPRRSCTGTTRAGCARRSGSACPRSRADCASTSSMSSSS